MKKLYGMGTQGRRGMKADRINMAYSEENFDYIRVMAGIRGETMTQIVNDCLDADRERIGKVYRMAKELAKEIE